MEAPLPAGHPSVAAGGAAKRGGGGSVWSGCRYEDAAVLCAALFAAAAVACRGDPQVLYSWIVQAE